MAGKFIPLYDAEKKLLSDRYLDLKFEQDIDDFVCVRCDRLAIVHFFTNCGHLLCLNCKRIIDNGGFTCPQCNTLITNASEHRDEFERRLFFLRTKCPNTKYGCQFTTNLAQIPEHVGMCKFTRDQALPALSTESNTMFSVLEKINEHNGKISELNMGFTKMNDKFIALDKYKEDLKMELRGLRFDVNIETRKLQEDINHLKKEIAVEIQLSIETNLKKLMSDDFKTIKEDVKKINLKKEDLEMELRALKSDVNIETRKRQEDDNQLKKEMQIIEINLKKLIADEFRAMKGDMKKMNLENSTIQKEIATINDKVKDMEQQKVQLKVKLGNIQLTSFKDPIKELLKQKSSVHQLVDSFLFGSAQEQLVFESLCLKWIIKHKDLSIPKKREREHVSDIYSVYGFQPKAQLKLTIYSSGDIGLHLCFLDEAREGQEVGIKPLPMLTFIIKDLSGGNKHHIRYKHFSFKESLKYNQFGYGSNWINKSQWPAFLSPGAAPVEVLVLVEPMTIMNKPLSVDGTITHTIENWSRKLQMAKEGLIKHHWSPPFLTHAGGYRVAVWMRLNAYIGGNMRGLGARIYFLSGENDSQLGREFVHETSVTLINQWDASKSITVKEQTKEAKADWMSMATHDAMGSGGFLVNDSFTYHVTVKPIKY